MTKNKEKYLDEILELFSTDGYVGSENCSFRQRVILKEETCGDLDCEECAKRVKKWLEQDYIEPITLTEDEKIILKNLDKKYQYIVRNQNGNLKVCNGNVEKCDGRWVNCNYFHYFCLFDHLFQFIKWEDEKPYNIDELLKQNGVER